MSYGTEFALDKGRYYMMKCITLIIALLVSIQSWANQQPSRTIYLQPVHPDVRPVDSDNLQILDSQLQNDLIVLSNERTAQTQSNHEFYLRDQFRPKYDDSRIFRRILDRSANRILKSDFFKKSKVGKTAQSVKQQMSADVEFRDEKNIEHKFDFKFKPFQSYAYVRYTGFTTARLIYDYGDNKLTLSFDHQLSESSTMSINTSIERGQPQQYLSISHWW